jgi:hypothetical protein
LSISTFVRTSGNLAATAGSATIEVVPGVTSYLTGFSITGSGATAASVVQASIAGLQGGTLEFVIAVPAGVTAALAPLVVNFPSPLAAAGPNATISVNLPSLGAGNTAACVNAYGFRQ